MTVRKEYSGIAIALHWSVAVFVVAMLVTAFQAWSSTSEHTEIYWMKLHGSIGTCSIVLIAARIFYHFRTKQPPALIAKPWERTLAFIVHKVLLILLALQLVTGPADIWSGGWGIDVFGWLEIPPPFAKWDDVSHEVIGSVHRWTGIAIFFLVFFHTLAALKHHWIDGDRTLRRMVGF